MEYIKKEELIEGEIYYVSTTYGFWMIGLVTKSNNGDNSNCDFRGNATFINKRLEFNKDQSWCYKGNHRTYRLATPEEKHWLETCIKENKFVSYEEAMKSFIPEYVELLPGWSFDEEFVGEIFDTKKDFQEQFKKFKFVSKRTDWKEVLRLNWIPKFFKPSTKEAYDAQFVVIEPEFVLPEKWCILRTGNNYNIINKWFQDNNLGKPYMNYGYIWELNNDYYTYLTKPGHRTEITFEQFKKYVLKEEIVEEKVIEPLPQFKIIETIETITKVENNEGNQFFIGDVVKTEAGLHFKIIGFKYNENKTKILAIATDNYPEVVKDINDIEHYIEPKVEETLLEKAKRLYPVGTKVKTVTSNNFEIIIKDQSKFKLDSDNNIFTYEEYMFYLYNNDNNKWATIIE